MKITLKNIKFSEALSEETNAFTANIYADHRLIGYAKNQGHGGNTHCQAYSQEARQIFKEAEEYAAALPSTFWNNYEMKSNLEHVVDNLLEVWLKQKDLSKHFNKGLVYETPSGENMTFSWKGWTIGKLKKQPNGVVTIKKAIRELQSEGNKIVNTNLKGIL